ncbi:peptide-methionine (R)-S-oxide reductase MsrB [Salinisphaera sp. USBA-960]|uniref:peptide-methionine (R)-S-oxide reductase MsrB n=1 Tax=Salinisphaera orenii TaxID=856731 RepID=UPI000DBE1B9C|nr:peptide-methionine (R)-S-oxide reductase MsrB [Salifodinibacter halophilus]NNC27046.1 peptide-methionine (R)-S-oxide reductase MsrB [Salifodinibacter halophilus]
MAPSNADASDRLSAEARSVLHDHGTEPPGSSDLNNVTRAGTFYCADCGARLFTTTTKFDSGTGWPSFYDCIPGSLAFSDDHSRGMTRTEYHCANCGGHQGHVFPDGPQPTGLRYCNNGVALRFEADGD